jgi:phosphomannomutase
MEERIVKYIFDVDGTLTPSRRKIDTKFMDYFERFMIYNDTYLVTGSDQSKTIEQVGKLIYNLARRVYNCNGNDTYEAFENTYRSNWCLSKEEIEWLTVKLSESKFPFRSGKHIEQRPGLTNFSIIGRNCTLAERNMYVRWDEESQERSIIAEEFKKEFPEIDAKVAGETGIDIFPIGKDKSQILKDFNVNEKLVFFGDKMEPNGNDYELKKSIEFRADKFNNDSKCYTVSSYKDTWEILKGIFND